MTAAASPVEPAETPKSSRDFLLPPPPPKSQCGEDLAQDNTPDLTQDQLQDLTKKNPKATDWPQFHNKGVSYSTEFDEYNTWKCPLCNHVTGRIRQHLLKHKDVLDDWDAIEQYCREMAQLKRREVVRKADAKRAGKPERKEFKRKVMRKVDAKRADKPERKEVLRKVDAKRADKPERKEVLRKADAKREPKRADKPERKEMKRKADSKRAGKPGRQEGVKKAKKKYSETFAAKVARIMANGRYQEKLGQTRRRAQHRRYAQTKVDKARGGDALNRRIRFQKAVLRGPQFVCSSCHRKLFRKSVTSVTEKLREKIKHASEEKVRKAHEKSKTGAAEFSERSNSNPLQEGGATAEVRKSKLKRKTKLVLPGKGTTEAASPSAEFNDINERSTSNNLEREDTPVGGARRSKLKRFSFEADAFKAWNHHLVQSVGGKSYLCSTCKSSLQKGNTPAMGVANGLFLGHPDRPVLTDLENSLIAFNINFQKIVLLPKSRMAAGKGRMISVPVGPEDVMNTMKHMPRLPSEAGLVPIKLKRKKEYKSAERHEKIRPEIVFQALRYLKKARHPFYQFYDDEETYKARCSIMEQRDLQLLEDEDLDLDDAVEEVLGKPNTPDAVEVEDEAIKDSDEEEEDLLEMAVEQEEQDIQDDPVRRQHFNYSEYSALVNGHPEIFLDNDGNQRANLTFAPGEGKKPIDFLNMPHWEIKSWPTLLPDGKFGLDHKRKIKLTRQQYFTQRLLNKDDRFAKNPDYCFSAMSMVEAERLRSNANLTGMRGKRKVGPGGHASYQVEDPCSVFEKIPGTPKYWQSVKYEMIAKLENIGPFQVKKYSLSSKC